MVVGLQVDCESLIETVLSWWVSSTLWVWFMGLVPPYSFWGLGSGPLGKSFSLDGSLESKRKGLTEQALCSPAPGAHLGHCKSLAQLVSSAVAEDCAPMNTIRRVIVPLYY